MSVSSAVVSPRPGVKGTSNVTPPSLAAFSMPAQPASTMRSAMEMCAPPAALNSVAMESRTLSTRASWLGSLTSQPLCGSSRMRAPLAPPRLSVPRKEAADAHAVATSSDTLRPEASTFSFSARMSAGPTSGCTGAGTGSCQISTSAGTSAPT